MDLSFTCRIKEKVEGGYMVYLNASNITHIPVRDNVTIRKIFTSLELTTAMYYISGKVEGIGEAKKLMVKTCYALTEVKEPDPETKEDIVISKAVQDTILSKDACPSDVYTLS